MRPSVLAAALVVLLLAPASGFAQAPSPSATPAAPKVLVFPFAALGEQARANADLLRKNLVNAIDQLKDVDALDPVAAEKSIGKPLAEARDSCGDDNVCLQALASVAGARYLVRGGLLVEATGGFTVMLQAFDAERGAIHREPTPHKVASEAAAVESMKSAANWMFATTGLLVIHTPVSADVFINSKPLIGRRTPADRPVTLSLEVGKVNIRLEAAGWVPYSEIVTIKPGGTTTLKPLMKQSSVATRPPATVAKKPITKQPLFWGAVAAGVIALGAGAAIATADPGTKTKTVEENGEAPPPGTTIGSW